MLDTYANVPRYPAVFLAEKRDFIDQQEMQDAIRQDRDEPATHEAWRRILELNGRMRHAIQMLRLARENCGTIAGMARIRPSCVGGRWFQS